MPAYQSNFPHISPMQIGVLFMGPPYKRIRPPPPGWVYDGFTITVQSGVGNYYGAEYTTLGEGGWWPRTVPTLATSDMHWVVPKADPAGYTQLPVDNGWQPDNYAEPPWVYAAETGGVMAWTSEIKYKPFGVTLRYYACKRHWWHYEG